MFVFFFFFKQKTAYEIYQCDWSSDVCSSDLSGFVLEPPALPLFLWQGKDQGGLIGHMSAIGDFGPRHSFVADIET